MPALGFWTMPGCGLVPSWVFFFLGEAESAPILWLVPPSGDGWSVRLIFSPPPSSINLIRLQWSQTDHFAQAPA